MPGSKIKATRPTVGLALGSGSARGLAHIGVINALQELGIRPDVIAGTSAGALVGAAYACGRLAWFEDWVRGFTKRDVVRYLDVTLAARGGLVEGKRLIAFLRTSLGEHEIDTLSMPFAAVATDLSSGAEVWIRHGSIWDAARVSMAMPGVFAPVRYKSQWLVDGGLVNPVPVSLCRALGADVVIAVNLNEDVVFGRAFDTGHQTGEVASSWESAALDMLPESLKQRAGAIMARFAPSSPDAPTLFEVIAASIAIVQDQVTTSRMRSDPPEVVVSPLLSRIGLLEVYRAEEAIEEGRAAVFKQKMALTSMTDT